MAQRTNMNTTLIQQCTQTMPISTLGESSALPTFRAQQPMRGKPVPPHEGLNAHESENPFTFGHDSILPYRVQDRYDRTQATGEMPLVEICNGRLRATVAPHLGGRLMSLRDLRLNRELVFVNPVFQPANLAALNAWFSGGIEWNGPTPGHSPFTCSPVFCGVINTPRGAVLRLHEFDRIVEASWQIDLFMPAADDRLFVHGRIANPDAIDKLAYWWTNVAVQTTPGMRVVSPADYGVEHVLPGNQLKRFPFPDPARWDGSYPGNWHDATSVFFRKPGAERLWIAALDAGGTGLAQVACSAMRGRKFFYFGTAPGGRNWMNYLSIPGQGDYIEMQSGIAPTQNQRFALPALSEVHWTEGYAALEVAPEDVHASDYAQAVRATEACIQNRFPADEFADIDAFLREVSRLPMERTLAYGSAWGARQEQLTGRAIACGLDFGMPVTSTPNRANAWDELLTQGTFSTLTLTQVPPDFVVSPRWCALLERSAAQHGETWLHALSLGIAAFDLGHHREAVAHVERSVQLQPSWLGLRQRALMGTDVNEKLAAYQQAWALPGAPDALAIEALNFMLDAQLVDAASTFVATLPPAVRALERVRLSQARIAVAQQKWDTLEQLLDSEFATVREGETLLNELWESLQLARWKASSEATQRQISWVQWQQLHPTPKHLEFRMVIPTVRQTSDGQH